MNLEGGIQPRRVTLKTINFSAGIAASCHTKVYRYQSRLRVSLAGFMTADVAVAQRRVQYVCNGPVMPG